MENLSPEIKKMREIQESAEALREDRIKARKYTRRAKLELPKKIETPEEIMKRLAKKRQKAMEEAEETEKILYAPQGDAEKVAKKHEEQIKILEQVAEQKAEEKAVEEEKWKDHDDLKEIREKITAQRAKEENAERIAGDEAMRRFEKLKQDIAERKAYEQLAEELKNRNSPKRNRGSEERLNGLSARNTATNKTMPYTI